MSLKTTVHSPKLIVTRLRIEAALRHAQFAVRVEGGRLFVCTIFGEIPVIIESVHDGDVWIALRFPFGVCPDSDSDFGDFIARENERDDGIRLEVDEDGAVCFCWDSEFSGEVDSAHVVRSVALLGIACVETGKELRQRFFVQPVSRHNRSYGGME